MDVTVRRGTRDTAQGREVKIDKVVRLIIIRVGKYFPRIKRIKTLKRQVRQYRDLPPNCKLKLDRHVTTMVLLIYP